MQAAGIDATTVDVVVFDLDDTLLDHRGSAGRALDAWLPSLGVPAGPAVTATWFDVEERHFARWRAGEITFAEQRRARLREVLPHELTAGPDEALDLLFAQYVRHYEHAWQLFPDTLPCLHALRAAGHRTAVLTNGLVEQQNRKVASTGLADVVEAVFTAEGIGAAKPHPGAFSAVTTALGVAPAAALYVGDSLPVDYRGAREAGWQAVLLDRAGTAPPSVQRLGSLSDLPALLSVTPPGSTTLHGPRPRPRSR